ncbi:MAG TPA: nucleotidyl transferase AbiEii/AbiGii toxin family protein [Thermoanaerobaculaceae bacterium]|nr:nucleotidyl transferase AbiEii/AbiGii toxin family protein [Thermoanaerobaculaceae bacterium]HRS16992.1 nucleotidyl transferase AbiEii/AbiGii toxin family protein [Thermoanaerobaculaceae bacterium]
MEMTFHWKAIAPAVAEAFRRVSTVLSGTDFYLAGGTALALRLGHRESDDLDFFSAQLEDVSGLQARLLDALPDLAVTSVAPRTLNSLVGGVQVSFFGYRYPPLARADEPAPGVLPLAGVADIAAMKLAAIASRGSRKDFVDLWFLLQQGISLEQALDWFRRKYAMTDFGHVVRALVYFDDADEEPELRMLRPAAWADIKNSLRRAVERLVG